MPILRPDQSIEALKRDLGGSNEQSYIEPSAMGGTGEVQTITVPATASAAQADYFVIEAPTGDSLAFWLDIDADGTEPTGAAYVAASFGIPVSIVTGGTAIENAALVAAEMAALGVLDVVDNLDGTVTATIHVKGNAPAPARHNANDSGNGSFGVATTTPGTAPTVQGKYFTASNTTTSFAFWFSSSGNGTDPAVADHTAVEITLEGDESNAEYISLIAANIAVQSGLTAEVDGSRIYVSVDSVGPATDLTAGDTAFTVSVASQGGNVQGLLPSSSVTALSVTAQTIS